MSGPTWRVERGDCLAVLRELPDASVDAIVTDPPYGLGDDPAPADLARWVAEEAVNLTRHDFMGKDWQIPSVAIWRECLRVLRPGGHLLSFGGSRTVDIITFGIRLAGFEIRDSIDSIVPRLSWIHGQGFPKSLSVSAAIDEHLGAERQPTGEVRTRHGGGAPSDKIQQLNPDAKVTPITAPATPEAARYEGWGTALKPAHEPIVVARKPLSGTVAETVLAHGTGGLNIEACRVQTSDDLNGGAYVQNGGRSSLPGDKREGAALGMLAPGKTVGRDFAQPAGRWPPNLLLSHVGGPNGCVQVGTRKVRTGVAVQRNRDGEVHNGVFGAMRKPPAPDATYADEDGTEEVPRWSCAPGCPVAELDRQSGETGAQAPVRGDEPSAAVEEDAIMNPRPRVPGVFHGDRGGASRFFPMFSWDPEIDVPLVPCALCGAVEWSCESASTAAWSSGRSAEANGSALDGAQLSRRPDDAARSERSTSCARVAGSRSRTSPVTSDGSAPGSVQRERERQIALAVRSAANLCERCVTSSARTLARTLHDPSRDSAVGADSISEPRLQTLLRSLAPVAEALGSIDTIPTTASLMLLSGYVRDAINATTTSVRDEGSGLDQTPFRYVSKPSRSERDAGLDDVMPTSGGEATEREEGSAGTRSPRAGAGRNGGAKNFHPTVKAVSLMSWLCRLVTPPGGLVLDPFCGSGSTGMAAIREGFNFLGIEKEEPYVQIAVRRISLAAGAPRAKAIGDLIRLKPPKDEEPAPQLSLFGSGS